LLHEITHYSQAVEGVADGANTDTIASNLQHEVNTIKQGAAQIGTRTPYVETASRILQKYFGEKNESEILELLEDPSAFGLAVVGIYNNNVGETEARNVETRMNLSPQERLNKLLKETEDVDTKDQHILFSMLGAGSPQLSSEAYNPRPGESKQDYIDRMREEVEANLLGANGEEYFKRIAKENNLTEEATKSFLQKIKDFIGQFSDWLANQLGFGNMTPKEAAKLSTKDLLDRVTTTMLRGDSILDKTNKEFKDQSNETDKIVKLQAIGFRFITPVTKKDVENISCT